MLCQSGDWNWTWRRSSEGTTRRNLSTSHRFNAAQQFTSFYGTPNALQVAQDLDEKVEDLLKQAAVLSLASGITDLLNTQARRTAVQGATQLGLRLVTT